MTDPGKIQLDDITFDDVIAGDGVSLDAIEDSVDDKEEVVEEVIQDELEIEDPKAEDVVPEEVEEEEDKEEAPVEDDSVVSEILAKLGYDLEGDYEDTSEGLVALTKDAAGKMAEDQLEGLFEKFPIIKKHLEYTMAGGDSKQFMETFGSSNDYTDLRISKDDVGMQKTVLGEYFHAKGHDKEFIDEILEDYEDSGKLFDKASRAKEALVKVQASSREQLVVQQKAQQQEAYREQERFWGDLNKTIDESTELAGITLPARDKKKFFEYISKPVTREGQTQRDLDHKGAELDVKLAMDYLMYRGFDLDKIISTKAKTVSARSLKDKISRTGKSLKSANKASRRKPDVDFDDLDLSI